jgi:hypothetical protein
MRVACTIDQVDLENDEGREVPGVRATCSRCQHETDSFGTGGASVRRCLAMMREECPEEEENYYTAAEDDA